MPQVNEHDVLEIAVRGKLHGQRVINTFHFMAEEVPDPLKQDYEIVAEAATDFGDKYWADYRTFLSNELVGVRIRAQMIFPSRGIFADVIPDDDDGSVANSALPSVCSWRISRRCNDAGRTAFGRVFLPGVPVNKEDDSNVAAAQTVAMQNLWDLHVATTLSTNGYTFKPIVNTPGRQPIYATRRILQYTAREEISSQAKRRVGRGE